MRTVRLSMCTTGRKVSSRARGEVLPRRTYMCYSGESMFLSRLLTVGMADSTCPSWHGLGGSWGFLRGLSDFQL